MELGHRVKQMNSKVNRMCSLGSSWSSEASSHFLFNFILQANKQNIEEKSEKYVCAGIASKVVNISIKIK